MAKRLSAEAVAQYRRDGFYFPLPVLSADEAQGYRRKLETYEQQIGGPIASNMRHKTHLLFTWANELARHPAVLDAVEDVIGPDILCWSTTFFIKEPQTPAFVSWHQDATYWGLSTDDVITAWIAFADAPVESGAMKFWPGSHSLHHVLLVHGSGPNTTHDRRVGFAMRYIPPHVKQLKVRDSAMLVRGRDTHGNFDLEPSPKADLDEAALAVHRDSVERSVKALYAGTDRTAFRA